MGSTTAEKTHTLTIRVPRVLHDQVRSIAERESETHSTILRRLIRRGLADEKPATYAGGSR